MRTWHEAQLYCRRNHTDLAIIRDAYDHDQIISLTSDNLYTWIGLFRDSWRWTDGTAVSSTFVKRVNANGENEACGLADSQGRTEDATCSLLLPFVCSRGVFNSHRSTVRLFLLLKTHIIRSWRRLMCVCVCTGQRRQIVRFEVKSKRGMENDTEIQAIILQRVSWYNNTHSFSRVCPVQLKYRTTMIFSHVTLLFHCSDTREAVASWDGSDLQNHMEGSDRRPSVSQERLYTGNRSVSWREGNMWPECLNELHSFSRRFYTERPSSKEHFTFDHSSLLTFWLYRWTCIHSKCRLFLFEIIWNKCTSDEYPRKSYFWIHNTVILNLPKFFYCFESFWRYIQFCWQKYSSWKCKKVFYCYLTVY